MTMTEDTTITQLAVETAELDRVEFDIYRDVHKGIRSELFAVTSAAGAVDPGDHDAVAATTARFGGLVTFLVAHAEHEEEFLQGLIEVHAPQLAAIVMRDHRWLECQMAQLEVLADQAVDAAGSSGDDARRLVHKLYLGLASFTSDYLGHQSFEELEISPALSIAIGPDELAAIDAAIVASIAPEDAAVALGLMLPAMNVDDRVELLGGMQVGAPPEVFAATMGLAETLLDAPDYRATAARLGVS
jgi:hypothetical protein